MKMVILLYAVMMVLSPRHAIASPPPANLKDAIAGRDHRDISLAVGTVRHYLMNPDGLFSFPAWERIGNEDNDTRGVAVLGAVLFVYAYQNDIATLMPEAQATIDLLNSYWDSDIKERINEYLANISPTGCIGTDWDLKDCPTTCDYDMALMGLVNLVFTFKDTIDPNDSTNTKYLLSTEQIRNILSHQMGMDADKPFLSFSIDDHFASRYCGGESGHGLMKKPETENHVLMIYAINYLTTAYILWAGALEPPPKSATAPDGSEGGKCLAQASCNAGLMCFVDLDVCGVPSRYDPVVKEWFDAHALEVLADLNYFDDLMQALGRVVHLGFFETNGKPYQKLSLGAILSVAIHGQPDGMLDVLEGVTSKVREAAVNAFNQAAAKFAFQSLRSKRSAPHRRRWDNREDVAFYKKNEASVIG